MVLWDGPCMSVLTKETVWIPGCGSTECYTSPATRLMQVLAGHPLADPRSRLIAYSTTNISQDPLLFRSECSVGHVRLLTGCTSVVACLGLSIDWQLIP